MSRPIDVPALVLEPFDSRCCSDGFRGVPSDRSLAGAHEGFIMAREGPQLLLQEV
jgi:hypothetical protein